MKICPTCQTAYDDSQNFCLNDGASLIAAPTQVVPLETAEENTIVTRSPTTNLQQAAARTVYPTANPVAPPLAAPLVVEEKTIEKKSNTGKIVALTALGTILLVSLAAGGAYLALRNRGNQQVAIANTNANVARPRNTNSANVVVTNTANANSAASANVNANTNANANVLPTPKPSLNEAQAKEIRQNVQDALDGWKDSTENRNIESHIGFYAPTVDFYNSKGASAARVRADREKAFDTYSTIEIDVDNVKITPDASGEKATAVLDKSWRFENDETTSEGKVQQQLTLEKRGNRWVITGEKDLKQYYANKY